MCEVKEVRNRGLKDVREEPDRSRAPKNVVSISGGRVDEIFLAPPGPCNDAAQAPWRAEQRANYLLSVKVVSQLHENSGDFPLPEEREKEIVQSLGIPSYAQWVEGKLWAGATSIASMLPCYASWILHAFQTMIEKHIQMQTGTMPAGVGERFLLDKPGNAPADDPHFDTTNACTHVVTFTARDSSWVVRMLDEEREAWNTSQQQSLKMPARLGKKNGWFAGGGQGRHLGTRVIKWRPEEAEAIGRATLRERSEVLTLISLAVSELRSCGSSASPYAAYAERRGGDFETMFKAYQRTVIAPDTATFNKALEGDLLSDTAGE